jgi:hypothetical protein
MKTPFENGLTLRRNSILLLDPGLSRTDPPISAHSFRLNPIKDSINYKGFTYTVISYPTQTKSIFIMLNYIFRKSAPDKEDKNAPFISAEDIKLRNGRDKHELCTNPTSRSDVE